MKQSTIKVKVFFVLKVVLLLSPLLIFSLGELLSGLGNTVENPVGKFLNLAIFPLLAMGILFTLYLFKEIKQTKALKIVFLVVSSIYFVVSTVLAFMYLGFGIAFGMSIGQSIYIPLEFIFIVASAIFFTIESIKQIKSITIKDDFENEKD
jgi:hypothetical protein